MTSLHFLALTSLMLTLLGSAKAGTAYCNYTTNKCYSNSGNVVIGCYCTISTRQQWIAMSTNPNWVPPETGSGVFETGPGTKILFDFRQYPTKTNVWFAESAPRFPSHGNIISALGQDAEYAATSSQWFRCDWQSYADVDGSLLFAMTINGATPIAMMKKLVETVTPHLPLAKVERHGWVSIYDSGQDFDQATIDYYKSFGQEIHKLSVLKAQGAPQFFTPLRYGDAWGTLKLFPNVTATGMVVDVLHPLDIVVFDQLPLDLGVVQGTLTTVFQTVNSHINLKSAERETPNMMLFNYNAFKLCFANLAGKPIRYSVNPDGWVIAPSTMTEVKAKYQEKVNKKAWIAMSHISGGEVTSFDDMCPDNDPDECLQSQKKIFGSKASTLGFLAAAPVLGRAHDNGSISHGLGYDLTPLGFGIPNQYFLDFVNYPGNEHLKAKIAELQRVESTTEPLPEARLRMSEDIIQSFYNATLPPRILRAVRAIAFEVFVKKNITGLKFRSSANAEDMPGFDGAGLYDSYAADYYKESDTPCYYDHEEQAIKPKTFNCAIKGVYASLYNVRGIQERTFARFRHDTCVMGIAVVAQYDEWGNVSSNAVLITRDIFNPENLAYSFGVQKGEITVTNPEPGTIAESTLAMIQKNGSYTLVTKNFATPGLGVAPLTKRILTDAMYDEVMRILLHCEYSYCIYHQKLGEAKCRNLKFLNVKPGLDLEWKFFESGKIHVKQMREFTGNHIQNVKLPLNVNNSCEFVTPAYFDNPDSDVVINAALDKPTSAVGISAANNDKLGNDGIAITSAKTCVVATTSWKVTLGGDYETRYVRIVGPPANYNATMSTFRIRLYLPANKTLDITYKSKGNYMESPVVLPINGTKVNAVELIGLSTASTKVAFSELQVWARPLVLGDPADFPEKTRPVTGNCTWDAWGAWSPCDLNFDKYPATVPTSCGPNSPYQGRQNRTRAGAWCDGYELDEFIQHQFCPIPCSTLLTKPGFETSQGKITPSVQCYTKSTPRQLWTSYFNYRSELPNATRIPKGTMDNLLTYNEDLMVYSGVLISMQLEDFKPGYQRLAMAVPNTNSVGSTKWSVAGSEAAVMTNGTNFVRCPEKSTLAVRITFPFCPDLALTTTQFVNAMKDSFRRIAADNGFSTSAFDSIFVNATVLLDDPSLCEKKNSTTPTKAATPTVAAPTPRANVTGNATGNVTKRDVEQTTLQVSGTAIIDVGNPEGVDPDYLIYESFDAIYFAMQPKYANTLVTAVNTGLVNGTIDFYKPPPPDSIAAPPPKAETSKGLAVWIIAVIVVAIVVVIGIAIGAYFFMKNRNDRPTLESAIHMDAMSSTSVSKYKIPVSSTPFQRY